MVHLQRWHEASATFDSNAANSDSHVASLIIDYEETIGSHLAKVGYHASVPDASISPLPNGR